MTNIHVKFASKITGESTHKKHAGEIGVDSASWSVANAATSNTSKGAGGGRALATCSDMNFTKALDKSSPELMWACAKGDAVADTTVTFTREVNGKFIDYLTIKLTDVRVSSYNISGSAGGGDHESFSLNFAKIEYTFTAEDQGGVAGAKITKQYDFAKSDGS